MLIFAVYFVRRTRPRDDYYMISGNMKISIFEGTFCQFIFTGNFIFPKDGGRIRGSTFVLVATVGTVLF